MPEETNIQIVGNALRRLHAAEESATTAGTVLVDYQGKLVPAEVYLPTVSQFNVTTTAPEKGEWMTLVLNEPLVFSIAHVDVDGFSRQQLHGKSQDLVHLSLYGGRTPIAKNITWRMLMGSRNTTDKRGFFGAAYGDAGGQAVLTNLAEIRSATKAPELGELTKYLLTFSRLPYGKALAERILEIDQDLMEEAEGERLSSESLFSLIRFVQTNMPISRPALAAGVGGYLIARWKSQGRREINIHFRADGLASFYASIPTEENPDKREFLSATSLSIESLSNRLTQLQVLGWMR